MNSIKQQLSLLPLGEKIIPVEVTDNVLNQIRYLCKTMPKHEWSGILFYEPIGSIKNPKTLKIIIRDIFLMDKGSAASTEYFFNEDIVEYRMNHPETLKMQMGHIHSHNVMNVFFSHTDNEELTDNAPFHNYYLSLIVNNYLDFSVKIAFLVEYTKISAKDERGENYSIEVQGQKVVYYYNGQVKIHVPEIKVDSAFKQRTKLIIEKVVIPPSNGTNQQPPVNSFDRGFSQQSLLPFKPELPIAAEEADYDVVMGDFARDVLQVSCKQTLPKNLEYALRMLPKIYTNSEEITEYVANTIDNLLKVYGKHFNVDETSMETYIEDIGFVYDLIAECNESDEEVMTSLSTALDIYVVECEKHQYAINT